jgi:hypothetical protein
MQVAESPGPSTPRRADWKRVWILTGLDELLEQVEPSSFPQELLTLIDSEIDMAPASILKRQLVRVGIYHEDLRSREIGFEVLGAALSDFFTQRNNRRIRG